MGSDKLRPELVGGPAGTTYTQGCCGALSAHTQLAGVKVRGQVLSVRGQGLGEEHSALVTQSLG